MKFIKKLPKNEPLSLRLYSESTPNSTYSGYPNPRDLKLSLLEEQGYICAYCMQRISLDLNENSKPKIEVEHIKPQSLFPEQSLDYNNMVGVCNGNSTGVEHCDKSKKKDELKVLFPTKKNCEDLITYSISGKIKSVSNNSNVEKDLNNILKLNNQHLVDKRKDTIDLVIEKLKEKYPLKDWTKRIFDNEIETFSSRTKKGVYYQFCNYIVWYLNELKNKPRYK